MVKRAWKSVAMKHLVHVILIGKWAYQILGIIKNGAVEDKWNKWIDFWYNANLKGDSGRKVSILGVTVSAIVRKKFIWICV
jgi:hypothetical protein